MGSTTTLPKSEALTDVSQCAWDVVEAERAVDVDPDVAVDTPFGEGLEVCRTRLHPEHPQAAPRETTDHSPDRGEPQQRRHRPAHAPVAAAAGQRPPVGEHRSVRDQIEHMVEKAPSFLA